MRIDAHQHFWAVERADYGWLETAPKSLFRDFLPEDFLPFLSRHSIDGTVLVQAAPTRAETDFMLRLCEQHAFIKGVVGWVDFEDPTASTQIAELAKNPKLVGLRPMIQDIDDPDWMLRDILEPAFRALVASDLVFDALTLPRHLENLYELLQRYPDMRVVIDHGSKPEIAGGIWQPWADDIAKLARDTSCFCKISGLITEASAKWMPHDVKPYIDHLIACFGPDRLIWGSDWPVCTLAGRYEQWIDATDLCLAECTAGELAAILGDNAVRAYGLTVS